MSGCPMASKFKDAHFYNAVPVSGTIPPRAWTVSRRTDSSMKDGPVCSRVFQQSCYHHQPRNGWHNAERPLAHQEYHLLPHI
jgi:hypothetical protein